MLKNVYDTASSNGQIFIKVRSFVGENSKVYCLRKPYIVCHLRESQYVL